MQSGACISSPSWGCREFCLGRVSVGWGLMRCLLEKLNHIGGLGSTKSQPDFSHNSCSLVRQPETLTLDPLDW